MRRVLGDTLRRLGYASGIADLSSLSRCTNVIRHGRGGAGRRYEVVASVGEGGCLVQVQNGRAAVRVPGYAPGAAPGVAVRALPGPAAPLVGSFWDAQAEPAGHPPEGQELATLPESGRGLAICEPAWTT